MLLEERQFATYVHGRRGGGGWGILRLDGHRPVVAGKCDVGYSVYVCLPRPNHQQNTISSLLG